MLAARTEANLLTSNGCDLNAVSAIKYGVPLIFIICKLEATRRTLSREGGYTTLIRQAEAWIGAGNHQAGGPAISPMAAAT